MISGSHYAKKVYSDSYGGSIGISMRIEMEPLRVSAAPDIQN